MGNKISTEIFLQNYIVKVGIGIHPHEKKEQQRFSISVYIPLKGGGWVDYSFIKDILDTMASEKHYDLQEEFVQTLLEKILQSCDAHRFNKIEITTKKPDIYSSCEGVGIKIIYSRGFCHRIYNYLVNQKLKLF